MLCLPVSNTPLFTILRACQPRKHCSSPVRRCMCARSRRYGPLRITNAFFIVAAAPRDRTLIWLPFKIKACLGSRIQRIPIRKNVKFQISNAFVIVATVPGGPYSHLRPFQNQGLFGIQNPANTCAKKCCDCTVTRGGFG